MKVNFLGTGTSQGIPVIGCSCDVCTSRNPKDNRLRSSLLVSVDNMNIIIDTSIDFRMQMLRAGTKHLEAVIFTHEHKDHTAGLDDIRAFNFKQEKPMDIYAEERVRRALTREFEYVFAERKYPGVPQINMHIINEKPFSINGLDVLPLRIMHNRLPILGFRIGNLAYITDVSLIPDSTREQLNGLKLLILGAIRKEKHYSHFSLDEALDEILRIKPEQAAITHIGHQMGLHDKVQKELPENVFLAYDGLELELK
ncbi:MAG: MBL fold metallo-hydrolase [Bacteroidales bacterium]|nr:MBL fold metallo-hydrolase [Bacteroidales bacterium]